jgi:O-antigen ligase
MTSRSLQRGVPNVVSAATLFPVYLSFGSLLLFRIRSYTEAAEAQLDASSLHKVAAVILIFGYVGSVLLSRGLSRRWPATIVFFSGYLFVGILSLQRSEHLAYSGWKLAELGSVLLVALYVLRVSRGDPVFATRAYRAWLGYLSLLLVSALVSAIVLPEEALRFPVSEETAQAYGDPLLPIQLWGVLVQINPNSLGAAAAILLFVQVMTWLEVPGERTLRRLVWICVVAGVLILAQSRTAWLGFAIALVVGLAGSPAIRRGTKAFAAAAAAVAVLAGATYVQAYVTRGASAEHLAKLSGRTEWWTVAIREVLNADALGQLLGLGFMSANRSLLANRLGTEAATLHSDYIDALVSTGFVGVGLFIGAIAAFTWLVAALYRRRIRSPLRTQITGIACILGVRSVTGTTFAVHNHFILGYVLLAVLCFELLRRAERIRPQPAEVIASPAPAGEAP